jgi:WD40 repeat protein
MTEPKLQNGVSWQFGAPVVDCRFDSNGIGAFALGDGTLRIFSEDTEPVTVEVHQGAILSLAVHPSGGFLTGGDDRRLVHTVPGQDPVLVFTHRNRWIEHIAVSTETGLVACSAGKEAIIVGDGAPVVFTHATTVGGLAFDPKGRRLAATHYNGTSLWWTKSLEQEPKVYNWKGSHHDVVWSPDGRFIVTTMQESALHGWRIEDAADMRMSGYPAKIKSMNWERRGKVLFTGGAPRVIGWPFTGRGGPMGKEPLEVGPERDAVVQVVVAHPEFDLIAAGTSDGAVWFEWIGEEGTRYVLLDAPKISTMAFTPDGSHLAVGTEDGYAALIPAA